MDYTELKNKFMRNVHPRVDKLVSSVNQQKLHRLKSKELSLTRSVTITSTKYKQCSVLPSLVLIEYRPPLRDSNNTTRSTIPPYPFTRTSVSYKSITLNNFYHSRTCRLLIHWTFHRTLRKNNDYKSFLSVAGLYNLFTSPLNVAFKYLKKKNGVFITIDFVLTIVKVVLSDIGYGATYYQSLIINTILLCCNSVLKTNKHISKEKRT
ncbi:hypothetical protein AGLY_009905 [Aphis glycines]|uniref:Uncharacterized protein n=1 Tax=Aphis glycines TaxID=307491 RepID=A0A6G0TH65_APHGL|nr:hypothetical protein AGLY_009905 [Aphis glycines]